MGKDICSKTLEESYGKASTHLAKTFIGDSTIRHRVEAVALCLKNRAGVRALLAGLLAKVDDPKIDIRKPYTDIAGQSEGVPSVVEG